MENLEQNSIASSKTASELPAVQGVAGIEYVGLGGISQESQDGVLRLLQYGDKISHASILSSSNDHGLLLTINVGDMVGVKSGFSSGYLGEGPHTFSYVLEVLEAHGVEIEEYNVSEDLIERLDMSCLTKDDLNAVKTARPVRPSRWRKYIIGESRWAESGARVWRNFPLVIPFSIVDGRIVDLAMAFWDDPDDSLFKGYRRLEDIVRKRTGIVEDGAKLFSQAFKQDEGKLTWKEVDEPERIGRVNLFTGAYMAYRNRRAHRECKERSDKLLLEFLLLNHLYALEKESAESVSS
jgi:uncharacterized protein (TIGR02391 family)